MESTKVLKELDRLKNTLARLEPAVGHVEAATKATAIISGIAEEQVKLKNALQHEFSKGVAVANNMLQEEGRRLLADFGERAANINEEAASHATQAGERMQVSLKGMESMEASIKAHEEQLVASVDKLNYVVAAYERLNFPAWMDETGKSLNALDASAQALVEEQRALRHIFEKAQGETLVALQGTIAEITALKSGLTSISTAIGAELGASRNELRQQFESFCKEMVAKAEAQTIMQKQNLDALDAKTARAAKFQLAVMVFATILCVSLLFFLVFRH